MEFLLDPQPPGQLTQRIPFNEVKTVELSEENMAEFLALLQKTRMIPAIQNVREGSIHLLNSF